MRVMPGTDPVVAHVTLWFNSSTMPKDLDAVLREATSVRVSRVGEFDPRNRKKSKPLFIESDPQALMRLRSCFAIHEESLLEQHALMCSGNLDLNFLSGHSPSRRSRTSTLSFFGGDRGGSMRGSCRQ